MGRNMFAAFSTPIESNRGLHLDGAISPYDMINGLDDDCDVEKAGVFL